MRNEQPFPVVRPYSVKNPFLEYRIFDIMSIVKGNISKEKIAMNNAHLMRRM